MYNGQYMLVNDFSGGMTIDVPSTNIKLNQATDCDNMIILPQGSGVRSRPGDVVFNATAMNSGADVQGVGYFLESDGTEFLVAIAGAKIYKSDSLDGTMDDITDGYAGITAGQDNIWTFLTFNDQCLGFGGPKNSPDAAITYTGTGTVAALANAPAAYGALTANNRVFAYRTAADPSSIFWTIIGDPTDWSGSGSGSVVIGSLEDNEKITCAKVISTNYMLVFKETSTHQIVISSAPFSNYTLFDDVGCVGKDAAVNIDGTVFFISQNRRMYSTNGETIKEYPGFDKMFDQLKAGENSYIHGRRIQGKDFDWLLWVVRWSTLDDDDEIAFIWDVRNNCWMRCTAGFSHGCGMTTNVGDVYFGSHDGKVYKTMQEGNYNDDSETGDGDITATWQSGWINPDQIDKITQVGKITVTGQYKASGNVTLKYGHDGLAAEKTVTISQTRPLTTGLYFQRSTRVMGRGNTFQYQIVGSSDTIDIEVFSLTLAGKTYGQKDQEQS